jgi:preprotein translocase SecE subunit
MATDVIAHGMDDGGDRPPPQTRAVGGDSGGFFHIYKKGQGYWTRMGTAAAAGIIAALCIQFLYSNLNVWLYPLFDPGTQSSMSDELRANAIAHAQSMTKLASMGGCLAFLLGFAGLVFWLLNKPDYADFLIATDSEMKKVNWTTRKELIGSTKVVIIFMFLIAFLLFAFDLFFGYLFYFMDVLKNRPL